MVLKPLLPVLDYVVNYNYISKVLCVNKDKPMMHCNGKCHLMKEMAKEADSEKPISSDKKITQQESEILFFQEIKDFNFSNNCSFNKEKISDTYNNIYFWLHDLSIFHPPTVIS